jgi:predicted transglutaminase-like cysteine proteinase
MRLVRCLAVLLAVALDGTCGIASDRTPATALAGASLFGTREVYSPDNSAFFKWTGVLARFAAEQRSIAQGCKPGTIESCWPARWRALVATLDGLDPRTQLERVNDAINRYPYVPSLRNWGESNYWETPFEFLLKGGQCQDYAVAKYLLLRAAGVPADKLRVVVLRDTSLGLDHAVTVAYVGGQALMLDNQIRDVVPAASVHHYEPYYSINEQGWWLHQSARARYAVKD